MADTPNDGGPAFPTEPNTQPGTYAHHGMTLRDWFAAQVLNGLYSGSNPAELDLISEAIAGDARLAYRIADAMLAARTRETQGGE